MDYFFISGFHKLHPAPKIEYVAGIEDFETAEAGRRVAGATRFRIALFSELDLPPPVVARPLSSPDRRG